MIIHVHVCISFENMCVYINFKNEMGSPRVASSRVECKFRKPALVELIWSDEFINLDVS